MRDKPIPKSRLGETELDKADQQFEAFEDQIKSLTLDEMNKAPVLEQEPQTKLSQNEIARAKDIYLKPRRSIQSQEKFNEKFRESYNFDKEYVHFTAENKELIGENVELWTKPYAGMPAEEWEVPVNKPVWGPRYLAEQLRRCQHHVLEMDENRATDRDAMGSYNGVMVAKKTVSRITCEPVTTRKSVFMGANGF